MLILINSTYEVRSSIEAATYTEFMVSIKSDFSSAYYDWETIMYCGVKPRVILK